MPKSAKQKVSAKASVKPKIDLPKVVDVMNNRSEKDLERIRKRNQSPKLFTEKDQQIKSIQKWIESGVMDDVQSPEKIELFFKKKYKDEDTAGQHLSTFSTFVRRLGHQFFDVPETLFNDIMKNMCLAAKELRKPKRAARANGDISQREKRRDVHTPFPELQKKARENYENTVHLYSKTVINTKDHDILLDAFILMLYTMFYNIRSRWVDLTEDFHPMRENGMIITDTETILVWNRRKSNNHRFVQHLPPDLHAIVQRWKGYHKGEHLLVTKKGKPLTRRSLTQRIQKTWTTLLGKSKNIGVSDMRRSQITHLARTVTDPLERRRLPAQFHHSKAEHDLYFRDVPVEAHELVEDGETDDGDDHEAAVEVIDLTDEV